MKSIILSICIPTYNRGTILYQNLKYNLNLNLDDVEFIISDNGSQDNTEKLIGSLNDKRIKYFKNEKNIGYDANILKLIEKSSGNYIFLLSDEDILNLKEIEQLVYFLRNNQQFTLILGSIGLPKYFKNEKDKYYKYYPNEILSKKDQRIKILFDFSLFHYGYMSGIVLKRSLFKTKELYIYDRKLYMHYVLIAQAIILGPSLLISKIFCYMGPGSKFHDFQSSMKYGPYLAYQIKKRVELIKIFFKDDYFLNLLLNCQRNDIAYYLAFRLHNPLFIYKFFLLLPHIINIEEMKIKKMDFWIKVFFYIPLHIIQDIVKYSILNRLPILTKNRMLNKRSDLPLFLLPPVKLDQFLRRHLMNPFTSDKPTRK